MKRVGDCIPIENVDPHSGSYLDYGVIVGWVDEFGKHCPRNKHSFMLVEPFGHKISNWTPWCEDHVGKLVTLSDMEALQNGGSK